MKIKEGYILDEIGDQKVAISLKCGENDFSEMIKLNEIGAFLWEKLSEEIEEEKLVEAVTEAYDIDSATARKDIRSFTETLEKKWYFGTVNDGKKKKISDCRCGN